jgi:hypothetical protein
MAILTTSVDENKEASAATAATAAEASSRKIHDRTLLSKDSSSSFSPSFPELVVTLERRSGSDREKEAEGSAAAIAIDDRGMMTTNHRDGSSIPPPTMTMALDFVIGRGGGGGGGDDNLDDAHDMEESTTTRDYANDDEDGRASADSDVDNKIEVDLRDVALDHAEEHTGRAGGDMSIDLGRDAATGHDAVSDAPSSHDVRVAVISKPVAAIERNSVDATMPIERTISGIGNGNGNGNAMAASLQTDIYGRIPGREPKYAIACPNCDRHLSSSRLAVHLEKCMGLSSSRRGPASAAAGGGVKRKKGGGRKRGTTDAAEHDGGDDGKVSKQRRVKRKSKDS